MCRREISIYILSRSPARSRLPALLERAVLIAFCRVGVRLQRAATKLDHARRRSSKIALAPYCSRGPRRAVAWFFFFFFGRHFCGECESAFPTSYVRTIRFRSRDTRRASGQTAAGAVYRVSCRWLLYSRGGRALHLTPRLWRCARTTRITRRELCWGCSVAFECCGRDF